jgi:hypothetical protein
VRYVLWTSTTSRPSSAVARAGFSRASGGWKRGASAGFERTGAAHLPAGLAVEPLDAAPPGEIFRTLLLLADLTLVATSWSARTRPFYAGIPVPRGVPPVEPYLPRALMIVV